MGSRFRRTWREHRYIQASHIPADIVEYAAEGNTVEEIAHELGVSASSVRRVLEEECQNETN